MRIFRGLEELPAGFGPAAVSIGNFDGVHCGHRLILERLRERARTGGLRSVAVTFNLHPMRAVRPEASLRLITPLDSRLELLAATGIDAAMILPFTPALSRMRAADFIRAIVRDSLRALEVHEGANFRFGHRAEAGATELQEMGRDMGFAVTLYGPCAIRGCAVSSSRIRELLLQGDLRTARALLGRSFFVRSTPARGRGVGATLDAPTINLAPYSELLPPNGVYVTRLRVGTVWCDGVSNIGYRPTFGPGAFAVETHLLDFQRLALHPVELDHTTPLKLVFLKKLRDERAWPSPEALQQQIFKDVARARRYHRLLRLFAG